MLEPKRRFPMNVFHMTEIIELLSGSVSVLNSIQRFGLHGLMLPRSWLLLLFRKIDLGLPYIYNCQQGILDVAGRIIAMLLNPNSGNGQRHTLSSSPYIKICCLPEFSLFDSIPNATRIICVNRLSVLLIVRMRKWTTLITHL